MKSESSTTAAEQALNRPPNVAENQTSCEATIDSNAQGGTESKCNNDDTKEKSLELANELAERGTKALKESDYAEAADCLSRALEIRVSHYGELALECVHSYYQYGRALLYKAQEEADPLAAMPKKDAESKQASARDDKNASNAESSAAFVSSITEQAEGSFLREGAADDASGEREQEENDESDDEDLAEAEEEDSDLDLAWKMLDVARAISEKHSGDTMDKVDILSALAEVALEREDIETSLSDYQNALSILERLVESDSRYIAELNFRICLCLEIGCKHQEAFSYCQKALSICKLRVQRLLNEVKSSSESATSTVVSELDDGIQQSSNGCETAKRLMDKEAEVETLTGLSGELEKKLEDLQQLVLNPKSILSEILEMATGKAGDEKGASPVVMSSSQMSTATNNEGFEPPTVSTAHKNGAAGVTHLGAVGRGVKRVLVSTSSAKSSPLKKPASDPSSDKGDGNIC